MQRSRTYYVSILELGSLQDIDQSKRKSVFDKDVCTLFSHVFATALESVCACRGGKDGEQAVSKVRQKADC